MCVEIRVSAKKQSAKGLPPKWKYVFTKIKPYVGARRPYVPGLCIFHPDCPKTFRSIEAVTSYVPKLLTRNPNVVADFNRHVGVKSLDYTLKTRKQSEMTTVKHCPSPKMPRASCPADDDEGTPCKGTCGECENCTKDACGQCARCTGSLSVSSQCCFQKVRELGFSFMNAGFM